MDQVPISLFPIVGLFQSYNKCRKKDLSRLQETYMKIKINDMELIQGVYVKASANEVRGLTVKDHRCLFHFIFIFSLAI